STSRSAASRSDVWMLLLAQCACAGCFIAGHHFRLNVTSVCCVGSSVEPIHGNDHELLRPNKQYCALLLRFVELL
ncbi:hypothetical protein COO60DRAFT_1476153, partial [Scenedesmus sp. NREL 46B-D3]